jgi:L-asparaginase II
MVNHPPAAAAPATIQVLAPSSLHSANPVVVEVTRGGMVESRHRAAVAVADADGGLVAAWGEVARPIYGRSAIKPLQALPLIETGAADRFALAPADIALACASHAGEDVHVKAVTAWLGRIGCSIADLECGAHMPRDAGATARLIRAGAAPVAAHSNCSGKHTGFLTTARHMGEATAGYIRPDHPVQARLLTMLEAMTGIDLRAAPRGTDGCGIPVIGIPLAATARAMARLADPAGLAPVRAVAARRIVAAMAAHPIMVSGSGEFSLEMMSALAPGVVLKTGAEGVFAAALPSRGLGIVLKVDDGAERASGVVLGAVLRRLGMLTPEQERSLAALLAPRVRNIAGIEVGQIRPATGWPA